ncbi:hypothetical protein AK812_SmicGene13935 [Symbiodinium microadriaticum]|uniref:Uncharacterized protein n=1 Tax=Symbiodinium microadriaticum TaxID=2951 RepID=A0A1Q9E6W2_SYMMI|nr:hypothetical protein AK812_SmicGene13935 [Symbiodinium microadriaticum]
MFTLQKSWKQEEARYELFQVHYVLKVLGASKLRHRTLVVLLIVNCLQTHKAQCNDAPKFTHQLQLSGS